MYVPGPHKQTCTPVLVVEPNGALGSVTRAFGHAVHEDVEVSYHSFVLHMVEQLDKVPVP